MTNKELARENAEINRKLVLWACDHENNVSSMYSNFLTTLAGLFVTLSPLVLNEKILKTGLWLKISLSCSILFIFLSLIFGGIYIFLKRKFFSKWADNYSDFFVKWNECGNEDGDIKAVLSCESFIYSKNETESPQWPLIVQSALLSIGVLIILVVVIIKVYTY